MTQKKLNLKNSVLTAIVDSPDTELKEIFLQALRLVKLNPSILDMINWDLDKAAKEKKAMRLKDQEFYRKLTEVLPGYDSYCEEVEINPLELVLYDGRPRLLDAEAVFLLMMCKGHLDSVTSRSASDRLVDSLLIRNYFEARFKTLPAANTIFDSLNAVSNETREYIFKSQIEMIIQDGLDSMERVALDSFSVSGNTQWPTDSRILMNLLNRSYHIGHDILDKFKLPEFKAGHIPRRLNELKKLDFEISNTAGKPKSKKKVKRLYRKFLNRVNKILEELIRQSIGYLPQWEALEFLPPTKQVMAKALVDRIITDLQNVIHVYSYTEDRVFEGIQLPSPQKVLSLSDECASFINKGGREPVIGYKPQVVRSGNGFITAIEIQQGNPSDSSRLQPMIKQHCGNTGIIPETASVDDGYSSAKNLQALKDMKIKTVSIGGSKGKKITPEAEWNSAKYQDARKARSAVESIIFVLRFKFHLSSFTRRGLEAVTAELLEKVIAHNFWRMSYLSRKEKIPKAA